MRNFKNNKRRFRSNSFDKNMKPYSDHQSLNSSLGNVSDFKRKHFPRNNFNSSKLIQKYTDLAREALSSGDKILYENYMQHAEHFVRINENISNGIKEKNNTTTSLNEVNVSKIGEDIKQEDQI